MKLLFSDNSTIELAIDNSQVGTVYQKIYKNLTHVPIPFLKWDNPYYLKNISYNELVNQLMIYAKQVSVDVDKELCLQKNQQHFNDIHKIYEKNYDGRKVWLDFHEHIHMCEEYHYPCRILHIDYREKSGLLEKKFDMAWMSTATTKIKKGDIFIEWSELGKTPVGYWKNNEPNNINRLCELSKPWLKLRPKLLIATEDIDKLKDIETLDNIKIDDFNRWWEQYNAPWCKHWGIERWSIVDMNSVIVFGKVPEIDTLIGYLKNNIMPIKVLV